MGSNPTSNLKLFMLVLTFYLPLLQLSFLPVEIPQYVMTIINDKNHLWSSVPCIQTSLQVCFGYWVLYQVHRPLITGRPSGLGNQGSCKVYHLLFTDPPQQVPSLPISHYRSLLIRQMEKNLHTTQNQS